MRRRTARRAERTSDVTRFRGVAVAAVCAALTAGIAAFALSRSASPGALARPHVEAGVACASCHGDKPPAEACAGCHGAHPSTRAGHAAVGCPQCHRAHGGGGVTFFPDGQAIRFGAGGERTIAAGFFRPAAVLTVPLPEAGACARCHDASATADPIAACLLAGQDALGDARPTVCFDEHRAVRAPSGALTSRSAAWEAAREVAAIAPGTPAPRTRSTAPWSWLGLGALVGLVAWGGVRFGHKRAPPPVLLAPVTELRRLPVIDAATCIGCHACVDACPYDVLEIRRYVAVVARPTDCCGLTLCEQKCPNGSLAMKLDGEAAEPAVALDDLESREVPGVFLAGDVTGQGLIRTAIDQGAHVVRRIAGRPRAAAGLLDLLIVGVGPAGLSAALEAQARGLRALALEQATVVDSIRSFPRGKLVIDSDAPTPSRLWLGEATKEELVARWLRTVREARPEIREGTRVTEIEPTSAGFVVRAVDRDGAATEHRAAHVLLAVGRRGSPRRLPIAVPASIVDHVHYALADARSFAGRRVLVVGLGDVAMETAIALSRQPGTEVVVSYRGSDFRRGRARNIEEMKRRVASGTLRLAWQSEITALAPGRATLETPAGPQEVACDSIFVLIGSDVPVHRPFPIPVRSTVLEATP